MSTDFGDDVAGDVKRTPGSLYRAWQMFGARLSGCDTNKDKKEKVYDIELDDKSIADEIKLELNKVADTEVITKGERTFIRFLGRDIDAVTKKAAECLEKYQKDTTLPKDGPQVQKDYGPPEGSPLHKGLARSTSFGRTVATLSDKVKEAHVASIWRTNPLRAEYLEALRREEVRKEPGYRDDKTQGISKPHSGTEVPMSLKERDRRLIKQYEATHDTQGNILPKYPKGKNKQQPKRTRPPVSKAR
jgi:hypothetical protein